MDDFTPTFECHGLIFPGEQDDQIIGTCPFCAKEDHFFVNRKTGQWDCKRCGKNGNIWTFLKEFAALAHSETDAEAFERLARQWGGIPPEELRNAKIGFNPLTNEWLLPVFSERGSVWDIRRWNGNKMMSTTGCTTQLYGMQELSKAATGTKVWICEGEKDRIFWKWMLKLAGRKEVAVGVPGAHIFKDRWIPMFRGMNCRLAYDNDKTGDDGAVKAGFMLRGTAPEVLYLNWPDALPLKWDLRDTVKQSIKDESDPKDVVKEIEKLLAPTSRRDPNANQAAAAAAAAAPNERPISFTQVLKVFRAWVKLDQDFEESLAISLAICLANDIPGDPVWLYLVGPPGGGKTVILLALQKSDRVIFHSNLTPASLVSGFKTNPDPSILPHLDGKTAVFKDGTELLAMHPDARKAIYGTLRGAFDGHVRRSFGNGVIREYFLRFNMIIGITPAIHGDNQATMGERFMKYEMREMRSETEIKIRTAMDNLSKEVTMQEELSEACRQFLIRQVSPEDMPPIPTIQIDRIIALAQLLSILRAQVEREFGTDRDLKYRPTYEVGTRIAKQLTKLGQMLVHVYGAKAIDDHIFNLLRRVALDTAIGFHVDIVKVIIEHAPSVGLTAEEIGRLVKIPIGTIRRRLLDLEQLGVVIKDEPVERRLGLILGSAHWRVDAEIQALWARAMPRLNGQPVFPREARPAASAKRKAFLRPQPKIASAEGKKNR